MKGKVKRLIRDRGFGFIGAEDGRAFFFHRSALEGKGFDALVVGSSVKFDLTRGPKGPLAVDVRAINA